MEFLFNKFVELAEVDENVSAIRRDLESLKNFEKSAKDQGFKDDYIKDNKNKLFDAIVANAETRRSEELDELEAETNNIKNQYYKKIINNSDSQIFIKHLDDTYEGFTAEEVKGKYNDFLNGKIFDPRELATLSKHLKKVDEQGHTNFRKLFHEKKLNEPWRVLNPETFDRYEVIQSCKYGEIAIKIKDDPKQGRKGFFQKWEIKDLLK